MQFTNNSVFKQAIGEAMARERTNAEKEKLFREFMDGVKPFLNELNAPICHEKFNLNNKRE